MPKYPTDLTEYEKLVYSIHEQVEEMTLAEKLKMINDNRSQISLDSALYYADEICQDVLLAKFTEGLIEFNHDQREHYVPQQESN